MDNSKEFVLHHYPGSPSVIKFWLPSVGQSLPVPLSLLNNLNPCLDLFPGEYKLRHELCEFISTYRLDY